MPPTENLEPQIRQFEAVVIGVSSGGLKAMSMVLPALPQTFPIPVIIVQHAHRHSDGYLAIALNEKCKMRVKEVDEKDILEPGVIYLAPPNYHLLVEQNHTLSLSSEAPVQYSRPSIDVLFETAAYVYRNHLIGIVLTGGNNDGSQGLKKIQEQGGLTIVQDPQTAEAPAMPQAAIREAKVDHILPLQEIGPFLAQLVNG